MNEVFMSLGISDEDDKGIIFDFGQWRHVVFEGRGVNGDLSFV